MEIEVETLELGAHRDGGNDRDPIAAIKVPQNRRPSHGGPSLGHRRSQEEARFVGEDEVGTQPRRVFFTRGQSSRRKRRIFTSSRSKARFCGFWWLQPRRCINRPTWSRWYWTRNFLRITSAIRAVVHSCVGYPLAVAPCRRIRSSKRQRAETSLCGRPGEDRTFRALSPPPRRMSRQRITELAAQPMRRATSLSERPSSRSDSARRRRSSNSSADPRSRIEASSEEQLYHSLCRSL